MRVSLNLMQTLQLFTASNSLKHSANLPLWIYCGRLANYVTEARGIVGVCNVWNCHRFFRLLILVVIREFWKRGPSGLGIRWDRLDFRISFENDVY